MNKPSFFRKTERKLFLLFFLPVILFCLSCHASGAAPTEPPAQAAVEAESALPEEPVLEAETAPEPENGELTEAAAPIVETENRQISDLLDTDTHFAYIKGYDNGMFKPSKTVSRAEAAQMFFSLLRQKDGPRASFSDVSSQWYAEAVEVMAGLDVIKGYSDGTFRADKMITRAEFVTLAVSCDTLLEGVPDFPDVSPGFWAAPYIYTAAEKGWISGFSDGTFHPNDRITRAQAVSILNRILGRSADPEALERGDAKNFYDMFPDNWAYGDVLEAATEHSHYRRGAQEAWSYYQRDYDSPEKSGWVYDGGTAYYLDAESRKFLRGEQTIDGKTYLFNNTTGAAYTGFRMVGSWRRYYKNGVIIDDASGQPGVQGPYLIKVYKNSNYLIVFARDENGRYNSPIRAMRASCGYPTITGTYYSPSKYRWCPMLGGVWAQWVTQVQGNYLIHSVPYWTKDNANLEVGEYNHLGETRSMGCIRLCSRDAKWIYDNCALGTQIVITTAENSGPLEKPAGIQIPAWHTWDPTDPTAYWRCEQRGCH